jgi:hypothetical protein
MLTLNVKNAGPVKGENVKVRVALPEDLKDVVYIKKNADDPGGVYSEFEFSEGLEPNAILPLFFIIDASNCEKINEKGWWSRLSKRNEYVRINVSVEYDYKVNSWMPLTIISEQEWRDRTTTGAFAPVKVPSHISTSPAKLSIGSFDQPLIAGNGKPFYLGFNLTSSGGKDSAIVWESTNVKFGYPKELEVNTKPQCLPAPTSTTGPPYDWSGESIKNRAVFCMFRDTPDPGSPSETYYITANASFGFKQWEHKDTLFAFIDVCVIDSGSITEPTLTVSGIQNVNAAIDSEVTATGGTVSNNGVTITWKTTEAAFSQVFVRKSGESYRSVYSDSSLKSDHTVSLSGPGNNLEPGQTYFYKIKSGGVEKEGGSFSMYNCVQLKKEACDLYVSKGQCAAWDPRSGCS